MELSDGMIPPMHIRFTHSKGLPVLEEYNQHPVGTISGILIHPDMGKVEGFFVTVKQFLQSETLFLAVADITHWGRTVTVRDRDVIAPLEEHVRMQQMHEEGRTVLGQKIVNETGKQLGTCADVQFETHTFRLEWLFPKKFFRWTRPIPVTSIQEVKTEAIVVREQAVTREAKEGETAFAPLDPLASSLAD